MGEDARRNDMPSEAKIPPQGLNHLPTMLSDIIKLEATKKFLTSIVEPIPRCECCWETRRVRRETYAAVLVLCARCEFQVKARGCCRLHNSRVFFPELADGGTTAADEPLEITMMFTAVPVKREPLDDDVPPGEEPDL